MLSYIAFLARSLKPSSINGYLNIIRILHLDLGLPNPLENNYAVKNLKRGIARVKGSPPVQKLPITTQILLLICARLCFSMQKDIVFWAACLVGYYGLFRKSTLLPVTLKNPGDSCLLRGDLIVNSCTVFTLHVRKTKTIQCGDRVLVLPFVSCPGSLLCPYKALMDLLIVAPKADNLPLFSYKKHGEILWLTHSVFVQKLRNLISRSGLDAKKFSGHSFRRGGATLCFELGLTMTEIKERGDWKSNAVSNYIVIHDPNKIAKVMVTGAESKATY